MPETPPMAASTSCSTLVGSSVSATSLSGQVKHLAIVNTDEHSNIPQQVSDETLALIGQANRLDDERPGPSKRARLEGPSDDPAAKYPVETKPLYLKSKNLHRKKLAIATRLTVLKKYFGKKNPFYTSFKCLTPSIMKNPLNKSRWEEKIKETKLTLLHILIEDMEEQYKATKVEIANLEALLRDKLEAQEWNDLQSTLNRKYKAAVQFQLKKSEKLFPSERKIVQARRRQQKQSPGPSSAQQGARRRPRNPAENNLGSILKKFTDEIQKLSKN